MEHSLHTEFERMGAALFVAYRALRNNETPVACIMVDDTTSEIISVGYNGTNDTLNGTRHAEFIAIDYILDKYMPKDKMGDQEYIHGFFSNVVLYVTVEPCVMCASALKQMRLKKVVYGCGNDRFGGNGTVLLVNKDNIDGGRGNYSSFGGVMRTEAIQLLRNFYIQENDSAPVPKIKVNKQIEAKEYPSNIRFDNLHTKEEFESFYTHCDTDSFYTGDVNLEITPNGKGYTLRDFVTESVIGQLPDIEILYPDSPVMLRQDLELFYTFFYDIVDQKVQFSKSVTTMETLNERKRKIDET